MIVGFTVWFSLLIALSLVVYSAKLVRFMYLSLYCMVLRY